eukprot:9428535-Ditylum_brightwellii.AAC.1
MRDIDIVLELHTRADKLEHFGFTSRHFTPDFIEQLKSEMPAVVKEACRDHDLDKIKPTSQILTRLQKRIVKNRKMLDEDSSDSDSDDKVEWQKDA